MLFYFFSVWAKVVSPQTFFLYFFRRIRKINVKFCVSMIIILNCRGKYFFLGGGRRSYFDILTFCQLWCQKSMKQLLFTILRLFGLVIKSKSGQIINNICLEEVLLFILCFVPYDQVGRKDWRAIRGVCWRSTRSTGGKWAPTSASPAMREAAILIILYT